jgi:hypothetical protein
MNAPSNTPARMRSNARARRNGSARRCARRTGVIAIALLAVTAAGFAYGTAADAATNRSVTVDSAPMGSGSLAPALGALGESLDALLDAVLPHPDPDDDSDRYGDDPYQDGLQHDGPQFDSPQHDGPYQDGPQHDGLDRDGSGGDGQGHDAPLPLKSAPPAPHGQDGQDRPA